MKKLKAISILFSILFTFLFSCSKDPIEVDIINIPYRQSTLEKYRGKIIGSWDYLDCVNPIPSGSDKKFFYYENKHFAIITSTLKSDTILHGRYEIEGDEYGSYRLYKWTDRGSSVETILNMEKNIMELTSDSASDQITHSTNKCAYIKGK